MINQTLEDRKDRYIDASPRVGADNKSIRPQHVACVVVCVGRAEHLALTLKHNAELVDEMIVVTGDGDTATQEFAVRHAGLLVSDAWQVGDAAFNKGAMINAGLQAITRPDWIIFTDADCFLHPNLRTYLESHSLNPGCLYSAPRMNIGMADLAFIKFKVGQGTWDALSLPGQHHIDAEPNGFLQIWNRRNRKLRDRWPGVMSEAFCSAGGIDSWFLQQFEPDRRIMIPELSVVHIAHGDTLGAGWNGRKRHGAYWRQLGWINAQGQWHCFEELSMGGQPVRLRLTDTLHGDQLEVSSPDEVFRALKIENGDLIFQGKPLHGCHVHVAYKEES